MGLNFMGSSSRTSSNNHSSSPSYIGSSSRTSDYKSSPTPVSQKSVEQKKQEIDNKKQPTDPNPYRFEVVEKYTIADGGVALEVIYPDCDNYDGHKVMVFDDQGQLLEQIQDEQGIDPHFLEDKYSPVARFEPTDKGWNLAKDFVHHLQRVDNNE